MKLVINSIYDFILANKKKIKQVSLLYSASIANIFLGIGTSIIVTRNLGPEAYGDYNLLLYIFTFLVSIVNFGFFISASRLLVFSYSSIRSRKIYGASLILTFAIFVIMVIGLSFYAKFDENLHLKGLTKIFVLLIPFSFIFPLRACLDQLLRGNNLIKDLSVFRFGPKAVYLVLLLLFLSFSFINLKTVLISYYLGFLIIFLLIIIKIKPIFKSTRYRLNELYLMNKRYGFHVYTGALFGYGLGRVTGLLLSYFGADNVDVGFFSLALMICTPLSFIPRVVGTTFFKSFAYIKSLPRQLTIVTIFVSFTALMLMIIFIKPVILFLYSEYYIRVVPIAVLVAIGVMFYGFGDYFNYFLRAHGKGKSLRNSAILSGISLLIANVLLIPKYGALGAGAAKIFGGFVYVLTLIIYYKRFIAIKMKNSR